MRPSLNVLDSCRTPYVASSDTVYSEDGNGPAPEAQCNYITHEGPECELSSSSNCVRSTQQGALGAMDKLADVSHLVELARQARQQLTHHPLRLPQPTQQETGQSQASQPSDTYHITAMDGCGEADIAYIKDPTVDTALGVDNKTPSHYPVLSEGRSSMSSPSLCLPFESVPSKRLAHTDFVPHEYPPPQHSVTVTQNSNVGRVSLVASVIVSATALALVAVCVHQMSTSALPISLGVHVAKQLQQCRYPVATAMAVAAVLIGIMETTRRCPKTRVIRWQRAFHCTGEWLAKELLRPHAVALPGSHRRDLQQQQQQDKQQTAQVDAEWSKHHQQQEQESLRPSEGNGQILVQQPPDIPTTSEAAASTSIIASTAAAVADGTQGGGPLKAVPLGDPEIHSSPFTTSAAVPSQSSFENSCLQQGSSSSCAASRSNAAHISGGAFTRSGSTWPLGTWFWNLPKRHSGCGPSRPPSLQSWAAGARPGQDGYTGRDAAQGAATSMGSLSSFVAGNGVKGGGGNECRGILSGRSPESTVAIDTRYAEESSSTGTDASPAVAPPDAAAGVSVAGDGYTDGGSVVMNTRSALHLGSTPSYVARLWQAALPGLHLLSRSQRQNSLPVHTDFIAFESQQFSRIGRGGGGGGGGSVSGSVSGSVATTLSNGQTSGKTTASTVLGSVNNSNGKAPYRPCSSQGIAGLASRLLAMASSASCGVVSMFGSSGLQQTSQSQAAGGNGDGGSGMHSRASRIITGRAQGQNSSNSVMNLVSDLLPRVAGGWVHSRSVSSTSLATLVEAAIGGVSSSHSGHGTLIGIGSSGGGGSGGSGVSNKGLAVTGVCKGDRGPAAVAGPGMGPPPWDPHTSGGTHAFLLSSAEAASRKPAFSDLPQNVGRVQVLSVDDEPVNQQVMRALLWAAEYEVLEARNGEDALEIIRTGEVLPDLVLLDVTLGGAVSGFEVCLEIRREYSPGELPVIMITCSSLEEDVIRGLAVGANDYLIKPLRNLELMARIKTQLALKRSIRVAAEARVNRSLLGSILPANVIRQLKQGVTLIAQFHQEVTILFSDIRGFTNLATEWPTEQIILMLNNMFTAFDRLCDQMGVYKVETIGDAYMIVSGHDGVEDHAARMLRMATHMLEAVSEMRGYDGRPLQIRVGVHTGPAHSGVVGLSRPRYCFFGDTVNTASRMESTGFPMAIQVSESTMREVTARPQSALEFQFAPCGPRDIKGKGIMHTFLLRVGLYDQALAELAATSVARASVTAPKRQGAQLVSAAAAAAPSETVNVGDVVETLDTAPAESQAISRRALKSAASSLYSGTPASMLQQSHWREQVALMAAGDLGCELTDHMKYASYRYHHQQLSCADVLSSTGTNALMDNGLAVLVPSNALDGAMVESLDAPPSGPGRFALASACTVAANASGVPFVSSGPVPMVPGLLTLPSSTRRLTTATGLGPLKASGSMLPHHVILANGGGASCALTGGASPLSSARPSLDISGRTAWGIAGSGAPHAAAYGAANPGTAGQEGAWAPTVSSQNTSMRNSGYNSATTPDPTSTRTMSLEMSECMEEPSLQYAVKRGAVIPGKGGAACALSPGIARVLSDTAAIGPDMSHGRPQGDQPGKLTQIRRSTGCTSEELTIAAAAAAAAASNSSGDDGSVLPAAAAAEISPQLSVDLETLIAAQGFLDGTCASTGGDGFGGGVENILAGATGGWSVLVEAIETSGAGMPTSGSTSTRDLTAQTLGNWIQGGRVGADGRVAQSSTAVLVRPPSKSQLSPLMHDCADADEALVLEPTLAVAAEALAAAIDGALNSDTGDYLLERPTPGFGLGAGGDNSCRSQALRAKLPSAPRATLMPSSTLKRAADVGKDANMTAASGSAAALCNGTSVNGRVMPLRGPSSPLLMRGHRTMSNGGMMRSQTSVQRLSCERPPLALNPGIVEVGGAGGAMVIGSAVLGNGSGSGGDGVRECAFEMSFQRPSAVPGNGKMGIAAVARHNSFTRRALAGLNSLNDGRSKDSDARPFLSGKRPATATGTIQTGISHNASQFLVREIAAPYGRSDGTSSAAAAAAGELYGSSPMAVNVQRSGLYGSSAGAAGRHHLAVRKRPATVHGAAVNASGLGQGSEHAPRSMAQGLLQSQHSAGASFRALADEESLGTKPGVAEEPQHQALAGLGPGFMRMDSSTSSRGMSFGYTNQANSRKSFTCNGTNRQVGGGVAAGGPASMSGNGNGGNLALLTSVGSAGGISIISQGWSNLYDPMCPRPRLTDHYCTSGDYEDMGSAGARTPRSLMSHSIGSANPWDQSAQPSPTLLTPMVSSTVTAAGGGGGGTGGVSFKDQSTSPSSAAAAATAVSTMGMGTQCAAPPGSGGPPGRGGATLGDGGGGGGGTDRSTLHESQESLAAEGKADCVIDPTATFEPVFGDISGVASGHDVACGPGDVIVEGAEAYMDVLEAGNLPVPRPHASQIQRSSSLRPQPQTLNPQTQQHSHQPQRLPMPTSHQQQQDSKHQYVTFAGRKLPMGSGSWLITSEVLEPSDAVLLLDPQRQGWLREPSVDDKMGRSGEGFASPPAAAAWFLGRSNSLDVGKELQLGDSAYSALYGNMYGCWPPSDVRVPGANAASKSARTWAGIRQEASQAMAASAFRPTRTTLPANEHHHQEYVHAAAAAAAAMPLAGRLNVTTPAPPQGDTLRSDERGLSQAPRGGAAAAAAAGLPAGDASLLVALATASCSSGSCPGGARAGFGDGGSSVGLGNGNGSHQLPFVSLVVSTSSPTLLASNGTADAIGMSYAKPSSVRFSRRHSVDVVRVAPPPPPPVANAVNPSTAATAGVLTLGSPQAVHQRHLLIDGLQPGGAGRTGLLPRTSDGAPLRRGPGGFGSPIGALGGAAAAAAAEAASLQGGSGNVAAGAGAGSGLGGLDLGRMLARASELVVVPINSNGGAGDGDNVKLTLPLRPFGSTAASKEGPSSGQPQPSSPVAHSSAGAGCPIGAAGAATKAAPVAATSATLPEQVAALALGPGGDAVPPNSDPLMPSSASEFHQPYHHHHHHHHPPLHSHHHHHQAMPYGLNQPVHVTRLDPVEEGCGSSAAITVDGSSASVAGSSVHNLPTAGNLPATTGTGSGSSSGVAPLKIPLDGPRLPSMIAREPLEHRQLSLTPATASAFVAAMDGVSFSNSGAGYGGARSSASASASNFSRGSGPATTSQHVGAGTGSRVADPWSSVGVDSDFIGSSADKGKATHAVPRGKLAKRYLSTMLRKMKNAFRSGAGGSDGR